RLALQRSHARAIPVGIREFPAADNTFGGFAELRRRLRWNGAGEAERNEGDGTTRHSHPTPTLGGDVTNASAAMVFLTRASAAACRAHTPTCYPHHVDT